MSEQAELLRDIYGRRTIEVMGLGARTATAAPLRRKARRGGVYVLRFGCNSTHNATRTSQRRTLFDVVGVERGHTQMIIRRLAVMAARSQM